MLTRKTFWDNAFVADDMFIHSIEYLHMALFYILCINSDGQTYLNAEFVCQSIFDGFRAENSDNIAEFKFPVPKDFNLSNVQVQESAVSVNSVRCGAEVHTKVMRSFQ